MLDRFRKVTGSGVAGVDHGSLDALIHYNRPAVPPQRMMIGTTLAHFRITAKLGQGGMGEVYRAEDTKLGREVAIKVLPEAVANDPERLARFEREARMLAALDHSNIAAIYGLQEAEGRKLLIMQLAPGETLAERIDRGPISGEEALPIALQIAKALEAAHEKGIIHRDLKPANVKVTPEGQVKVLDFGLAKALEPEQTSGGEALLTQSPTLTAQMTQAGVILGTAAYMSPEQVRGHPVDKRADIWAFGCLLFEMLTGESAFGGSETTEILASVLRDDPEMGHLPASLPPRARRIIERCLRKDPLRRLRDIGDARNELLEAAEEPEKVVPGKERSRWSLVPWLLCVALGALAAVLFLQGRETSSEAPPVRRFALDLPWQVMPNWFDFEIVISPKGDSIAYNGRDRNRVDAYVRALDSLEARPLADARGLWEMFFSPDGQWLGLFDGKKIVKVSTHGGPPLEMARFENKRVRGMAWGEDGDLLAGTESGLWRIPVAGGPPENLTQPSKEGLGHYTPSFLPDGWHALFTLWSADTDPQLAIVDLGTGDWNPLSLIGHTGVYSPSGHLVFRQGESLSAVAFDLEDLAVRGDVVPVIENVSIGPRLAADGTLIYVPVRGDSNARLAWLDRTGRPQPIPGERRNYTHLDLSNDGRFALLNVGRDVYVLDLERGSRRLLAEGALFPIWTSDGNRATFSQGGGIAWQPADGSSKAELLIEGFRLVPTSWNPESGELAYFDPASDIWTLKPGSEPRAFLSGPANERSGRFSPDGRWLAYVSDETGDYQVYVVPYPGPGPKITVSIDGGLSPIWSADGRELYFRDGGKLMAAAIDFDNELRIGVPDELIDGPYTLDLMGHQRYDVAPDGSGFLMVENSDDFRVVIVQNFTRELERLVPSRSGR